MKFTMTEAICPEGIALLKELVPDVEIFVANDRNPENYIDELKTSDAFIVRIADKGAVGENVLKQCPNLKVIGRTGVGYDSIDVRAAEKYGIPVVITPGANNRSVAEHTVAMMFALSKNLFEGQVELCKGNFKIRGAGKAFELEGKKVAVIGLGAIGREVVHICKSLDMEVLGADPYMKKEDAEALGVEFYEESRRDELYKDADILTIHVPLTNETENMIGLKELTEMKNTALVINCSRGGIINEEDLATALKKGIIAGAGLDVFVGEQPEVTNPLLSSPNIVLSPHSAAQTREAVIKMAQMCVRGCVTVCQGKKCRNIPREMMHVYDNPKWINKDWE